MANINDPATWSKFDDRTKVVLARIKEMFIDSVDKCDSCSEINCICGEEI